MVCGILVTLVCPILSIIQNILFGFFVSLFHCQCNFEVIKSIFAAIKYQTVILSDMPKFRQRFCTRSKWIIFLSLLTGSFAYLLPAAGLAGFLLLFETKSILCSPLEAPFLFNNSASLSLNTTFTDLYSDRKNHGGMVNDLERWEEGEYKRLKMPLHNLTDFISQVNYAGYHDICNYPEETDLFILDRYNVNKMNPVLDPNMINPFDEIPTSVSLHNKETDRSKNSKGLKYNYPGYIWKNSSGRSYKL